MMKAKILDFIKSRNAIYMGFSLTIILIFLLIYGFISFQKTSKTAQLILAIEDSSNNIEIDWDDTELKQAYKENIWLQNQYDISKDKVMSLGINLNDSLIQIQLSGLPLIQSTIEYYQPQGFLSNLNANSYTKLFGQPTKIISEFCNTPKKPIIKKKVVAGEDAQEVETDSIVYKPFYWELITENHLKIIVNKTGIDSDSLKSIPSIGKDKFKYYFTNTFRNQDSLSYYPTLFLWLDENDAKAIYRAIPAGAKVIFRN